MHRGGYYQFQPLEEETTILTDVERYHYRPKMKIAASKLFSLHVVNSSKSVTNAYLMHDDAINYVIKTLNGVIRIANERLHGVLDPSKYGSFALDSVIDTLTHVDLMDVAKAVLVPPSIRSLIPHRIRSLINNVRMSLVRLNIIDQRNPTSIRSPYYPDDIFEISTDKEYSSSTFISKPSPTQTRRTTTKTEAPSSSVVAVVSRINNNKPRAFKVLDPQPPATKPGSSPSQRGAIRSGCVCHQSSMVSQSDINRRILEIVPSIGKRIVNMNKRSMCEIYEIILRKHRPRSILST
jgi:hypothetical protein